MGVRQVVGAHWEELVMAIVSFTATPRADVGKGAARQLRSKGEVPAVIYGHGREPQALSLNARDPDTMLGHIQAESTVIEVSVGGATSKTHPAGHIPGARMLEYHAIATMGDDGR